MLKSVIHALRLWRKTPGFTLVSVSSLAIGIGATSAMFSFSDALLLRPLPVPEASRVATVCHGEHGCVFQYGAVLPGLLRLSRRQPQL